MRYCLTFFLLISGCGLDPDISTVTPLALERLSTSEQVLDRLRRIEHDLTDKRDRRAIFATAYRITTENVRRAIRDGRFRDRQWIEQILVAFANQYFAALDGQFVPRPWQAAFEVAQDPHSSVLRNLALSMNAHILHDLPIAVAEVGELTATVKADFATLNQIFREEMDQVQRAVSLRYSDRIWGIPLLSVADGLGLRADERISLLLIQHARKAAWNNAQLMRKDRAAGMSKVLRESSAIADLVGKTPWSQAVVRLSELL